LVRGKSTSGFGTQFVVVHHCVGGLVDTSNFRVSLHLKLLYADDLVWMADSDEALAEKIKKWNAGMQENA